jgi:hypothetical protein
VAASVVRTRDSHPNFLTLLGLLLERLDAPPEWAEADPEGFLKELASLEKEEQDAVLQTVVAAAIIDGRVPRREREFLKTAFAACGREWRSEETSRLRSDFVAGRELKFRL